GGRKTAGPAISRSLSSTRPDVCGSMPAAMRSNVVLPEPEGPSRQSTSPGSAAKLTSERVCLCALKEWLMWSKASLAAKVTPAVTRDVVAGDSDVVRWAVTCGSRRRQANVLSVDALPVRERINHL